MLSILIIDDSNDKVAAVVKTIRDYSSNIIVDVVTDFISAQRSLCVSKYDLLILDLNLPIRFGERTSIDVGKNLLAEISRKEAVNSPYYILALTQYSEECIDISDIWRTIDYNPESIEWKKPIINLIKHIFKCKIPRSNLEPVISTIFFEGQTDEIILKEAFRIFEPNSLSKISFKSSKSAGASWVSRQIIAWAHSLNKNEEKIYLKAVGLLDGDYAGKTANDEINRVIKQDSAESKTFKIFKLSPSYAKHMIGIKKKGLDMPITLEEMFPYNVWLFAKKMDWLEVRNNPETLLIEPKKWNKFDLSLKDYLSTLDLSNEEKIYLNCLKNEHKEHLVNHILSLDEDSKADALICFKKLTEEIKVYLGI